jgi:hypothetical protein
MTQTHLALRFGVAVLVLPILIVQDGLAWGKYGHQMINRLAGAALPTDVPKFLRSKRTLDALAYYAPEPDRWGSPTEPELKAAQEPEHFIDLEYADLVGELPRQRYDFVRALATAQLAHPDLPLLPEQVGLQPYVATEVWQRLKTSMREYRMLNRAKHNTKPVEHEIAFLAGWLGHYVADASQPLHTSFKYNGWMGPNPNGYTTEHHIHALFESAYVATNVKASDVSPLVVATPVVLDDVFTDYVAYLRHSHTLIEKVYQLEKMGAFTGAGTAAGKELVDQQLAAGATELRNMIYTAWVRSADPAPSQH